MSPVQTTYPGVYIEETRTSVKVIPGVSTTTPVDPARGVRQPTTPKVLVAAGYSVIATSIEPGGLAMLFGKDDDHVLVRMVDYRDGSSIEGDMLVTFVGKVP